jgi:hypothetical protein
MKRLFLELRVKSEELRYGEVCLLRKRFLGFGYAYSRNDGKKFGLDLREMTK